MRSSCITHQLIVESSEESSTPNFSRAFVVAVVAALMRFISPNLEKSKVFPHNHLAKGGGGGKVFRANLS